VNDPLVDHAIHAIRAIRHEQAGQAAVLDRLVHESAVLRGCIAVLDDQLHAVVLESAAVTRSMLGEILFRLPRPRPAVGLEVTLTNTGDTMTDTNTVTLDVDVTGEQLVAQYVDDRGDVTTTGPAGPDGVPATIGYASSDTTVVTVDATGSLSFLQAGTVVLTATANDSSGAPVAGFSASVNLVLTPGVATALEVSVEGAPPVPAPEPAPEPTPAPPTI